MSCVRKSIVGFALSVALCAAPTAAIAAQNTSVQSINPMVALSLFGSPASAAALCGNQASASTAAAAANAATSQAPAPGCVLPYADPLPPAPVVEPAPLPPAPVAAAPSGFGVSPLLLGLLGIAGLAALIASQGDDDNGPPPVSPN